MEYNIPAINSIEPPCAIRIDKEKPATLPDKKLLSADALPNKLKKNPIKIISSPVTNFALSNVVYL